MPIQTRKLQTQKSEDLSLARRRVLHQPKPKGEGNMRTLRTHLGQQAEHCDHPVQWSCPLRGYGSVRP